MNQSISKNAVFNPSKSIEYTENGIVSKLLSKKETGNVTLFAFDKNQGLSEHTAPFDAIIQLLDGEAEVTINKEKFILSKEDMIIMPANIPHSIYASSAFKMLLTMIKG